MTSKPTWTIRTRHIEPRTNDVLSLNLHLGYLGRECDMHIFLMQPLRGQTPENEAVLDEFRHLRDALNDILGEP